MKVLIATKSHMTQYFDIDGVAHPVTVLSNGSMTVIKNKTVNSDGYSAIQVGTGLQKESRLSKAVLGNLKGFSPFKIIKEFRNDNNNTFETGQILDVSQFEVGDLVQVRATSKGKGFQGAVKRHGFKGKGSIHNARHALREVGSIGGGGRAGGRVVKGKKMPGRMGGDTVTVSNLRIMAVDPTTQTMLIKGAVPGIKGGVVEIIKK
jgi:large subunit ribosomal protein L3